MKTHPIQVSKALKLAGLLAALGASANAQLLHRYDFNTVNDTVGTANGTLEGSATLSGGALVTSGGGGGLAGGVPQNGMLLPSTAVAGITGAFTIETWFIANYNGGFCTAFSFSDSTTANYVLATPARGNAPYASSVSVVGGGGSWTGPGDIQASEQYEDSGTLHDMVVTYDGTTLSYYIDGALGSYSGLPPSITDAGLNLSSLTYIGVNGGSPYGDNSIKGSCLDFRLYGQALTPAQVASIYTLGSDANNTAISAAIAPATSFVWNGAGADNNWSTGLNWIGGAAPAASGTSLTFAGSTRPAPNLNASYSVSGLTFSNTASSFAIGTANSSILTLAGDVINNSVSTETLSVPLSLGVAVSLNAASGSLVVNSNITLGTSALTLTGTNNFTLNGNITGTGAFTKNGAGNLNLAGGSLSAGSVSFNNGTTIISNTVSGAGGTTYVGYFAGNGIVNMSGGTFNDGGEVRVGGSDVNGTAANGTGTFNIFNSTVNVAALTVARGNYLDNSVSGTVNLNNGATFVSTNDVILQFAGSGLGKLAINGGNFTIGPAALKWIMIGYYDSGEGELDITNGNIFLDNNSCIRMCRSGNTGPNVVNQAGGAVTFYADAGATIGGTGVLDLNYAGGGSSSSTYNLNGGTLTTPQIVASSGSGTSTFNFNGGTLKPAASSATFMQGLSIANVLGGGAIIDTTNLNITIAQSLQNGGGGGGLTKIGSGTLALEGGYAYAGPTVVRAGTLILDSAQSSSSSDLAVTNATLSVLLNNGSSSIYVGNLTFASNTVINLNFGTATAPTAAAISASTINATGTNVVNVAGQFLTTGQYPLIYIGSPVPTSNFKLGTLPTGVVATLVNSGSSLDLLITASGQNLTWYGADASGNTRTNWDINTSTNWNSGAAKYLQYSGNTYGDIVTFDDTLFNQAGTNVNLAARVVPASLTANSSLAYSITGPGGIDGAVAVNQAGGGSFFLGTSNNYTGGTIVGNGTLIITNNTALGTNSGVVTMNGGTLEIAGNTTAIRPITVASNSTVGVASGMTAQLNGTVSGTAALTKSDNGTLTLAGQNTYAGPTLVSAGTLNLSGTVTNTSLTVANVSGNNALLNISGSLNVNSLFIGNNGTADGAVYQTGGNATVMGGGGDCLNVGNIASGFGYYDVIGGTVIANGIAVGGENNTGAGFSGTGGDGIMEINGGAVTNVGWMVMARGATGETGILNVFSGSITYSGGGLVCNWGSGQTSIINMMAGTLTSTTVGIGLGSAGNTGILNLNGGLIAASVVGGNFGGTFGQVNFNGGTLKAIAGSGDYIKVTGADIYGNGATIDDGGYAVTVNQPLLAPGGYGVSSISLSSGGSGYIAPPIVSITGGAGSNATAIATMSGGVVTGVTVTSPGSGYAAGDAVNLTVTFVEGGANAVAPTVNVISLAPNTSGGLVKQGSGTLTLTATNTYTGPTKVIAGTLAGTGVIAGVLTNNATLAPGSGGTGTLTINGNIVLNAGSTNLFVVNGTTPTNNSVIAGGNVTYGGVLQVTANGSFTAGQQFVLFSGPGATSTSSFASIQSSASGTTFGFTNGVLTVLSGIASNPTNILVSTSSGKILLSWPLDHQGWILQQQTNSLSSGIGTNWVDVAGTANVISTNITINPATPTAFYRLRHP